MKNWMAGVCGLVIGATMMVPGVSGGSMAMILGIYDRLIGAVSSFRKELRKNLFFLLSFAVGGAMGMFLFSAPLSWMLERFPMQTRYFFLGAVFGGVPLICKKAGGKIMEGSSLTYVMTGILLVFLLALLPAEPGSGMKGASFGYQAMLILMGVPIASALVLPGISVSHFLLLLGLYDKLIAAIRSLDISFLAPLGLGALLGVILITKLLEYVLKKYPKPSYLIILGFVLGSVMELFPGFPVLSELFSCICMICAGFGIVYCVSITE